MSTNMPLVVLGSASPWRRQVLANAGIECTPMSADIDEKAIRHPDPRIMTLHIALAKAAALCPRLPVSQSGGPLLITADQVAVYRGEVREKPANAAEARRWLAEYGPDEPVATVTAVVVLDAMTRRTRHFVDEAKVWFDPPLSARAIEAAIGRGDVLNSCGAFTIEDPDLNPCVPILAGDGDEAEIMTSIAGLPLAKTLRLLESFGWHLPDFDYSPS